jgi:predicted HicB family RNase H-like nuclease
MVNINIKLEPEVHKKAKFATVHLGITLKKYISNLIEEDTK